MAEPTAHAGQQSGQVDFQLLLDRWATAIVANDVDRIAAFAEPDWLLVTPEGGPVPLERFLSVVAGGELRHTAMAFELLQVRLFGDVAVVLARGTNQGTWQGTPFAADEWVTEVFVRRADGWRCTLSGLTPAAAGSHEQGGAR